MPLNKCLPKIQQSSAVLRDHELDLMGGRMPPDQWNLLVSQQTRREASCPTRLHQAGPGAVTLPHTDIGLREKNGLAPSLNTFIEAHCGDQVWRSCHHPFSSPPSFVLTSQSLVHWQLIISWKTHDLDFNHLLSLDYDKWAPLMLQAKSLTVTYLADGMTIFIPYDSVHMVITISQKLNFIYHTIRNER